MIITYAKSKYAFQQTTVSWTNKMQLVSRKGGKIKAKYVADDALCLCRNG